MQIVLSGNRVIAHGEDCFLSMGGTVVCNDTGRSYQNATVAEVDAVPADIDSVGYEYRAGHFVPCAPYGKGKGNLAVLCDGDCKAIKDSGWHMNDLLSPTTAEQYKDATAVPNDLFSMLSPMVRYHWKRRKAERGKAAVANPAATTAINIYSTSDNNTPESFTCWERMTLDEEDNLMPLDPVYISGVGTDSSLSDVGEALEGKYILNGSTYYYVVGASAGSAGSPGDMRAWLTVTVRNVLVREWVEYSGEWEKVSSVDPTAYPDGFGEDGYYYVAYGRAMDHATFPRLQMEVGTYVGTGTFGKNSPTVLTFRKVIPEFVIVTGYWSVPELTGMKMAILLTPGINSAYIGSDYTKNLYVTADGLTWSWYNDDTGAFDSEFYNGAQQGNVANSTYRYIAVGYGVE